MTITETVVFSLSTRGSSIDIKFLVKAQADIMDPYGAGTFWSQELWHTFTGTDRWYGQLYGQLSC